ncbi:adenosylcobinamide-phosphate synthase CbiB [Kiloniella laminariae]|uniref:Cobalamin biosynthesis protein CobD n=1 Tax=Kiloniella laminariae TaxID=454162 RepID=A0ABT4LHZ8_9PROT|nr:adenosylcobinamide-phosphate synthase CbiB [Kiloniella laminariae]MCZ4280728.1 adenosylcobinamide-phosphate synthase CbiB [Kiloniella laminariae]
MLLSYLLQEPLFLPVLTLIAAIVIDAAVGDPARLYKIVPHPVVLIGKAIEFMESWLNQPKKSRFARIILGTVLALTIITASTAVGLILSYLLGQVPHGWIIESLLASSLIAYRGLGKAVQHVATELALGLKPGRLAIRHLVGRDPDSLNEAGISRAAIESMAENFSDGVVAPVFWFALFGLPGICAYKAVNTLDSMIGHKNERYEAFGKFAARLDDVVNLIPARLAGLFFVLAALLVPGASARRGLKIMFRDAGLHRSPNAGWQEAAVAGALGFALAGPRTYPGYVVNDPFMGDGGRKDLDAPDIRQALKLYLGAGFWMLTTVAALLLPALL